MRAFTPVNPWVNRRETKIHLLGSKDIIFPVETLEMYPTLHRRYGKVLHFNNHAFSFLIARKKRDYYFIMGRYEHILFSLPDFLKRMLN